MINSSGYGKESDVPEEIKKWNWGAFWLTWIWGIGNKSYIALLGLIPILNVIMSFYLGIKGNELAWRNKGWYDIKYFKKTQKKWGICGWIIACFICIFALFNQNSLYRMEHTRNQIYKQAIFQFERNKEIKEIIGEYYTVVGGPNISRISENEIYATMILKNMYKLFQVNLYMDESEKIYKMKINFEENEKDTIKVIQPIPYIEE